MVGGGQEGSQVDSAPAHHQFNQNKKTVSKQVSRWIAQAVKSQDRVFLSKDCLVVKTVGSGVRVLGFPSQCCLSPAVRTKQLLLCVVSG